MTQSDRWKSRPCTVKYWDFKEKIVNLFGDRELPDTFHVIFIMPMPKSWSEKRKTMFDGKPHQQKPDASNLLKAFEDCLMEEDCVLWDIRATKLWGKSGSIEIQELEPFKVELNK